MVAVMDCPDLAVPAHVMQHVVRVESGFNPYAIGVVQGRLQRQPRSLPEAVATARMLEQQGVNFSVGLAQVNRYNLARYGLHSLEKAFSRCDNLRAGSRILQECHQRAGDWGRALSCYYSGNFVTGFRHGYVQKVMATLQPALRTVPATTQATAQASVAPIPLAPVPRVRRSAGPASAAAAVAVSPASAAPLSSVQARPADASFVF